MTTATNEVQTLAPGDIQHPAPSQQPTQQEQQPSAQQSGDAAMSPAQTAAISQLATMRAEAAKMPDSIERDQLHAKIGKLAQFAVAGGPKPSDFMPETNAKQDLTAEHDSMASALADGTKPLTTAEREQVVSASKAYGLPPDEAQLVGDLCASAALDSAGSDSLAKAIAGLPAGQGILDPLTPQDHAALADKFARSYATPERAENERGLAWAYAEHCKLTGWIEKYAPALAYSPNAIATFAFKARQLGLKAKG